MTDQHRHMIRQYCVPMEPIATSQQPVLQEIPGLRAVMFDIYGTLLISGSGDFNSCGAASRGRSFADALAEIDVAVPMDGDAGAEQLSNEIAKDLERARAAGVDHPEVDIVEIWRRTVAKLTESGLVDVSTQSVEQLDYQKLALAYELRVNPVWPMPGAAECLASLEKKRLQLGFISNAQFLTIELWQTLLRSGDVDLKIDNELQIYSFQHLRAKPGMELFQIAADVLADRNIKAPEVLYVGNDMLNDIMPAQRVGFRTALFAGDARSLRLRENDPRVSGIVPDLVIIDLLSVLDSLG